MSGPIVDATMLGTIGAGLAALATGAAGWFAGRRTRNAAEDAEVAEHGVATAAARGDIEVIRRLTERVTAAEDEIRKLHHELAAERRHRWHVENHMQTLDRALRDAGIQPPVYVPFSLEDR
jgi:uncharacterized protein HemX